MGNSVFSAGVFHKAARLIRDCWKTIYWCSRGRKPLYSIVHAHIQGFVTKMTVVAAKVQKTGWWSLLKGSTKKRKKKKKSALRL